MKSRTTAIWFVLAASLAAFIWIYQHWLEPSAAVVSGLLPGLRAADVTALQISPAGAREIAVARTNGVWLLQKPLAYPAQAAAVDALAGALEKLTPAVRVTAAELRSHRNADTEYGFDNPQFSLLVETGGGRRQLLVGRLTAPGDQVFIRVVGVDGVFVTDSAWLGLLPRTAGQWRDTALVDTAACDWIVLTNGTKVMEFRRDATNSVWRMTRPLPARADSARIATALQQLRAGHAAQFLTDDPRADLAGYGLQPADLAVWLGQGSNLTSGVEAGKVLPTNSAQVFARRMGWNTVMAAGSDAFAGWRGAVNDYRDPHLFSPAVPVAEIEVRGENNFILRQLGSNNWAVAGEKFAADTDSVRAFLRTLAGLHVSEFVKDVATAHDLEGFGLAAPAREIILRAAPGDTNPALMRLQFGTAETNRVFVKRADEDFVYAITPADFNNLLLFDAGWFYRDRHVWNFSKTNVNQLTLRQNGQIRQMVRTGNNQWSLAPGSQGMIDPKSIEQTVEQLSSLTVLGWVGRNFTAAAGEKNFGLNPNNLSITVELNTGEKLTVDFGLEIPKAQTALGAMTFGGERWAFIFPVIAYQLAAANLTIPPNAP